MTGTAAAFMAVVVVSGLAVALLLVLIAVKTIHRKRMNAHDDRRAAYLRALTRHLTLGEPAEHFGVREAEDDAFLDAVIDLRQALEGSEVDRLDVLVDRLGLVARQTRRLRRRWPVVTRLRAAVSLAEMGDEDAADVLMEHLWDREPEIRVQSARGLARMRHVPALGRIIERLAVETPWVRARLGDALVRYGLTATRPLSEYIIRHIEEPGNPGVVEAVRVLEDIGDSETGPVMVAVLLRSPDPEVQLAAASCLGSLRVPSAIRALRKVFEWGDWRIRAKVATALGKIGDASAIDLLVQALRDPDWWVRRNSAAALAHIPGGIDRLYEALDDDDRFARDAAAEALADAGLVTDARKRLMTGEATAHDRQLLRYMGGSSRASR